MSSAQRNPRGSLEESIEHARWHQTERQWEREDDIEDVQNISRVIGDEYAGKFKPPSAERAGRLRRLLDLLKPDWSSSGRWRYIVGVLVILLMAGGYLIAVPGLFDDKDPEVLPPDAAVEAPVVANPADASPVDDVGATTAGSNPSIEQPSPVEQPAPIESAAPAEPAPIEQPAPVESAAPAEPAVVEPAAPAAFAGTIVTDNGWFTITVAADGSVSGTMSVSLEFDDGSTVQSGSFAGTRDDDNVVTCAGAYSGVSTNSEGVEFPYDGTVTVVAAPTTADLSGWEIIADGEPGNAVVLPGHAVP